MKNLVIIVHLLLFVNFACTSNSSNETKELQNNIATDFIKTFEGKIGGKHEILMKITANNSIITGEYYYTKHQSELKLKGEIKADSLFLQEFNANKDLTGVFKTKLVNENKIEGVWSKLDGSKATEVFLIASNTPYKPHEKKSSQKSNINIAGNWISETPPDYTTPEGTSQGYPASMFVKHIKNNQYEFEIGQGMASHVNCTEPSSIRGQFNLKGNEAKGTDLYMVWSESEEKIDGYILFKFDGDKVNIKYEPYHIDGASCFFPDVLAKEKKKKGKTIAEGI